MILSPDPHEIFPLRLRKLSTSRDSRIINRFYHTLDIMSGSRLGQKLRALVSGTETSAYFLDLQIPLKTHRHNYIFIIIVSAVCWSQLSLGVSVFEFESYSAVTYYIQKILEILSVETNVHFFPVVLGLKNFAGF